MSWFDDRSWTAQYARRMAEAEQVPGRTTPELPADAVAAASQGLAGGKVLRRELRGATSV